MAVTDRYVALLCLTFAAFTWWALLYIIPAVDAYLRRRSMRRRFKSALNNPIQPFHRESEQS